MPRKKKVVCPRCGKPCLKVHIYKTGDGLAVHEVRPILDGLALEVTRSCFLSPDVVAQHKEKVYAN